MPDFRRFYLPDSLVFITCVTHQRTGYLQGQGNLQLFWQTLRKVKKSKPYHLLAYVVLPDHFHWILQTTGPANFSSVMMDIKRDYTIGYKKCHGIMTPLTFWQSRFWDHVIRDERDLENHLAYIHWNPVKHGYVDRPELWPESSFIHWAEKGYYGPGWRCDFEPPSIKDMKLE